MATETKRKMTDEEIETALAMFSGSGDLYRHWTRRLLFTEGIGWLADQAGAHWLIDLVASHQPAIREPFQVWRLDVREDRTAMIVAWSDTPGQSTRLTGQEIEYTDFPLESFEFYVINGDSGDRVRVMLLKSEY